MGKSKKTQNDKNRSFYKEKKVKEKDIEEICLIMKSILNLKEQVQEKYTRYLLDRMIWKATELYGKDNYKYKSDELLKSNKKAIHEHVLTKKFLIDKMIEQPKLCEEIVKLAVNGDITCGVTEANHDDLDKYDNLIGWERYKEAGIKVYDMITGDEVNLDELIEKQTQKLKELGII